MCANPQNDNRELKAAFVAIGIGVLALVISIWQTYDTRKHNELSVRPILQFERKLSVDETFKESGIWLATIGACVFVVDDSTGKVTGP